MHESGRIQGNGHGRPGRTAAAMRRPVNPQSQAKLRREKMRQKKLRRRRIIRNRIIAAVMLLVFLLAVAGLVKMIFQTPVWSKDPADFSTPTPEPVNSPREPDGDDKHNIDPKGRDYAEIIYKLKSIDSITIQKVSDYKEGLKNFRILKLGPRDLHRGDLVLVNAENPLPGDFSPEGLVNLWENRIPGAVGLRDTSIMLAANAVTTLFQMFVDMKKAGAGNCVIVSAYRTLDYQQKLLENEVEKYRQQGFNEAEAMSRALEFVARPGRSEHNYGYAIDVSAEDENGYILSGDFEKTPQGKWLAENSWRYGYIVRYPLDKVSITGIGYEPWHLRYVGFPHAALMKKLNLCLEEYIDYIMNEKVFDVYINGEAAYRIFYIEGNQVELPEDFSQEGQEKYSLSGNGMKGYIVTVAIN